MKETQLTKLTEVEAAKIADDVAGSLSGAGITLAEQAADVEGADVDFHDIPTILANEIREAINTVVTLMNEAQQYDIQVDFNIAKDQNNNYAHVTKITKLL